MYFCPNCATPREDPAAACPACSAVGGAATAVREAVAPSDLLAPPRRSRPAWPAVIVLSLVLGFGLAAAVVQSRPPKRRVLAPTMQIPPQVILREKLQRAREQAQQQQQAAQVRSLPPIPSRPNVLGDMPEARQRELYDDLIEIRYRSVEQALREKGGRIGNLKRGDRLVLTEDINLTRQPEMETLEDLLRVEEGTSLKVLERRRVGTGLFLHLQLPDDETGWAPIQMLLLQGAEGQELVAMLQAIGDRQGELETERWNSLAKREKLELAALERIFERGSARGWEYE